MHFADASKLATLRSEAEGMAEIEAAVQAERSAHTQTG
jgi:hypothetical protein